ncbi:MAG: hypothetical protein AB1333_01295 [Patescibacteria group bacterium]
MKRDVSFLTKGRKILVKTSRSASFTKGEIKESYTTYSHKKQCDVLMVVLENGKKVEYNGKNIIPLLPALPNHFPFNKLLLEGKLSAKTRDWKWNYDGFVLLYTSSRTNNDVIRAHNINPATHEKCTLVGIGKLLPVRENTKIEKKLIEKQFGNGKKINVCAGQFRYEFEWLEKFSRPIEWIPPKGAVSVFYVPANAISNELHNVLEFN